MARPYMHGDSTTETHAEDARDTVRASAALSGRSKLDKLKMLVRDIDQSNQRIRAASQTLKDEYGFNDVGDANREIAKVEGQIAALKEWTEVR